MVCNEVVDGRVKPGHDEENGSVARAIALVPESRSR